MPTYTIYYDQGSAVGPFNIYLSGSSGLSLYELNVSRAQLEGGYPIVFAEGLLSSSVVIDNTEFACTTEQQLMFPDVTPSITPTITVTPTISKTPTVTPSVTPTVTPPITVTPSFTPPPTVSKTPSITITPSKTLGISVTPTPTVTVTPSVSATPSTVIIYSFKGTSTQYSADYLSCLGINCGTSYYTKVLNPTIGDIIYTNAAATTPLVGNSLWIAMSNNCVGPFMSYQVNNSGQIISLPWTCAPIVTASPTPTITVTPTISITPTISKTPTITPTISITPTVSATPPNTITPTRTITPTISVTPTISITPTRTVTPTKTITPTTTKTPSISITPTVTLTPTPTGIIPASGMGKLYNWYAATDSRQLFTTEMRLPTNAEFITLYTYLGGIGVAGGKMKNAGISRWISPNTGATNSSGFNGFPSGRRDSGTNFNGLFSTTVFMTSSIYATTPPQLDVYWLLYYTAAIQWNRAYREYGISIRGIKDTTSLSNGQTGNYTGNDGKIYSTICIGTQEWLSENLKETKYRDGTSIPQVTDIYVWNALTTGAFCWYDNDSTHE